MNKQDIKLIHDFLPNHSINDILQFAKIDFIKNEIIATDTKKLLIFKMNENDFKDCSGIVYVHKKVMKLIFSLMKKDTDYMFYQNAIVANNVKIDLNTKPETIDKDYPLLDFVKTIDADLPKQLTTKDIRNIEYDLAKQNAYFNADHLRPVQEYIAGSYAVRFKEQKEKDPATVKIDIYIEYEEEAVLRHTAIIQGIIYRPIKTLF